jgi:UDP-glucose 4-epimerase
VLDDEIYPLLAQADYIFHLACVQIAHSARDPLLDLHVNAESTLRILEYLRHNKDRIPLQRFVYTSSASVYGSAKNYPSAEEGAMKVLSHYAATKLLGENYTIIYNKQYGISTSSVRYSNIFGYGQTPNNPYCGVMGKFIHNALTGKPLGIIGDGQQTRDYTFITDAIDATILAAVHHHADGEVFNIGTGIEASVNNIAELIQEIIPDVKIEHLPPRDIDNIRRRVMDIRFIQDKLGWEPVVELREGLSRTIKWYADFLNAK